MVADGFVTVECTSGKLVKQGIAPMKRFEFTGLAGPTGVAVMLLAQIAASGDYVPVTIRDITSSAGDGFVRSAYFQYATTSPTGTGVFDPFLTIQQQNNNEYEVGYNTDTASSDKYLDVVTGGDRTHAIGLGSFPIVHDPKNGQNYLVLALDVDQSAGNGPISLHQLQVFITSGDPPLMTLTPSNHQLQGMGSPVYSLFSGADGQNILDYVKIDSGHGNGSGDALIYVPFAGGTPLTSLVTVYTELGAPDYASTDGFDEWATQTGFTPPDGWEPGPTPVPEPSTVIAAALLLLPFGASAVRLLRNRSTTA